MMPVFTGERSMVYAGDALLVLPQLEAGSVDGVIADPPYCSGGATSAERTRRSSRDKYVSRDAKHALPTFTGDQRDQRSYLYWCTLWLAECLRLTRPGGICLVFTDWRQLPCLSDALQAAGWTWRGLIVWHKPGARPRRGGFNSAAEYVLWGSHGQMPAQQLTKTGLPGLYSMSVPRGPERTHITQKPLRLLRELVEIVPPGGTIFDPFLGSGTTGVAAVLGARRFIGVELSETFAREASERIGEAEARYQRQAEEADGGTS